MNKEAVLTGATGLVGSALLSQLLDDERFASVKVFVRRPTGKNHPKLKEFIIDFSSPAGWRHLVKGDVLFLTLGTTKARAGSKKAQYRVDHGYQLEFASAAASNEMDSVVLVSSAGAREGSPFFYMRMKAEVERDIRALGFESLRIIRPGPLSGPRKEKRYGEIVGTALIKAVNQLGILRSYKPVDAGIVAKAMINAAFPGSKGVKTYELLQVFDLAGHK